MPYAPALTYSIGICRRACLFVLVTLQEFILERICKQGMYAVLRYLKLYPDINKSHPTIIPVIVNNIEYLGFIIKAWAS